jgi:hypothetical protein
MNANQPPQIVEMINIEESARRLRVNRGKLARHILAAGLVPDAVLDTEGRRSPLFLSRRLIDLRNTITS